MNTNIENETRMALRRRIARRRRREGMTLVEIMIVVIIMALIATAVGVAVLPALGRARVNQTRSDAQAVRSAVLLYLGQEPGASCPTMDELIDAGTIDHSRRTTDAWDHRVRRRRHHRPQQRSGRSARDRGRHPIGMRCVRAREHGFDDEA